MENPTSFEKLKDLLNDYRKFLEHEVYPIELGVIHSFRQSLPLLKNLRAKAKEKKLFAPHLSEADGGLGLSLTDFAQVSEILGSSPIGHYIFNCQAPDIGNMELMHQFASPSLKAKYLKHLMQGEIRSCFAMTEPQHAGSNPVNMSTTAVKDSNEYIIHGHKWFTSAADGATFTIVMAQTDPLNSNPYVRASMILVPLNTPGYEFMLK